MKPQTSLSRRMWLVLREDVSLFVSSLDPGKILKVMGRTSIVVVAVLIGLEVFLQFSSLLAWSMIEIKPKVFPGTRKYVLCIGDSYASGKFVSQQVKPYPDFLQEILSKQGLADWQVLNFSSEFLSARDLQNEIRILVQKYQPELVYIMLGMNDFLDNKGISEGDLLPKNKVPEPPRQERLRTPLLLRAWRDEGPSTAILDSIISNPSFLLKDPFALQRKLPFSESDFSQLLQSSRNLHNDLNSASGEPNIFEIANICKSIMQPHAPPSQDGCSSPWMSLQVDALDLAEADFLDAIKINPENPLYHAGLAEVYFKLGRHEEAKNHIFRVESSYQSNPDLKTARALLYCFPFENTIRETSAMAAKLLKQYPEEPWFWKCLAQNSFLSGRSDLARRAIDRSLELLTAESPASHADFLRTKGEIMAKSDQETSVKHLAEAFLLDDDEDLFIDFVRKGGTQYRSVDFEKCLTGISCPPEKKETLFSLFQLAQDEQFVRRVNLFSERLTNIISVCRENRIRPVLLSYPYTQPTIEKLESEVAENTDAVWLNLSARFEILLKTGATEEFVKYGQLTEKAYRAIAGWIASDVKYRSEKSRNDLNIY